NSEFWIGDGANSTDSLLNFVSLPTSLPDVSDCLDDHSGPHHCRHCEHLQRLRPSERKSYPSSVVGLSTLYGRGGAGKRRDLDGLGSGLSELPWRPHGSAVP